MNDLKQHLEAALGALMAHVEENPAVQGFINRLEGLKEDVEEALAGKEDEAQPSDTAAPAETQAPVETTTSATEETPSSEAAETPAEQASEPANDPDAMH